MSDLAYLLEDILPAGRALLETLELLEREREARDCELSLRTFLRTAWPHFDPSEFMTSWHIDAIAEHLEAVTNGQIKRLLINVPPRTGKTNLVAIAWPVWTWALPPDPEYPLRGPGVRFLCASYGASKAEADGVTARRLIGSRWFQERWGERVIIQGDRDNQGQYDTTAGGSRISTGIPESLGKGGAIRICDDVHKTNEVESDLVREGVLRSYNEIWRSRSNDPKDGAEVVVMQRLHQRDLSGHIEHEPGVVHLMMPMEYDGARHCHTVIGFDDPRRVDGELLWPERLDAAWVKRQKRLMGPVAWSGQFQQSPITRGGGIIQRDWWRVWPPTGQEDSWTRMVPGDDGQMVQRVAYPDLSYILVSCDTAFTEREENDYSACTVWGSFLDAGRNPKVILLEAWRDRLEMRALVLRIIDTCRRRKADACLIESKASGISVQQEMRRLMRIDQGDVWTIFGDVPKGDKVARLHAVSAAFSAGLVYAPDKQWAEMVIEEAEAFPRSKSKDLCFIAGTMIVTRRGRVPIESVTTDDQVLTPVGWRFVTASGLTGWRSVISRRGLIGTANHPIFDVITGRYHPLDTVSSASNLGTLTLCSLIKTIRRIRLNSRVSYTADRAESADIISEPLASLARTEEPEGARDCTLPYGKAPMDVLSRHGIKSIIEIATLLTASLRIWSAYRLICTADNLRTWRRMCALPPWLRRGRRRQYGTGQMKGGLGIVRLVRDLWIVLGPQGTQHQPKAEFALGAGLNFYSATSAAGFAAPAHVVISRCAGGEERGFSSTPMPPRRIIPPSAVSSLLLHLGLRSAHGVARSTVVGQKGGTSSVGESATTHHSTIACEGEEQSTPMLRPVYNLTVADVHCYYANGVLVHNCDSLSAALKKMRELGVLQHVEEAEGDRFEQMLFRGNKPTVREAYGV